MSTVGAAPRAAALINARAEASRRNGAKSRGPKTPEGKAHSAQNALKHGFRAQKHVVLPQEDAAAFGALEAALIEELAPVGALQAVLAQRVVAAAWRLSRAERLEAELFAENHLAGRSLGLALIRDGNGSRSFDTLLRYRGGALAELWRALRTLKALQAEQAATPAAVPTPQLILEPEAAPTGTIGMTLEHEAGESPLHVDPIEPEGGGNPGESEPAPPANEPAQRPGTANAPASEPGPLPAVAPACLQRGPQPNEPRLELAQTGAAAGCGARRTAPEAIAPPGERRNPAAPPAQPSRSTP
jgi:hypothetical protein